VSGPVECAKKGARGDHGIGDAERALADALGDERANAALVAIAFGHDERSKAAGERVDLEVRGGAFDSIDETQDVRFRELAEPRRDRLAGSPGVGKRAEQVLERAILAEIQDLVLPPKIVVQIAG
jgi:hypothetical protein